MKLIKRNSVDIDLWNQRVLASANFRHYYLSYYLDASAEDWQAIVNDDYSFIWPLPIKTFPVKRIYQPLAIQQLGPLVSDRFRKELFADAFEIVKKSFVQFNIKFCDVLTQILFGKIKVHKNVELQIPDSVELLRKGYNRNAKANLKKAERALLEIRVENNLVEEIIQLFQSSQRAKAANLSSSFYQEIKAVFSAFEAKGEASCFVAFLNGELVAGALILNTNQRLLNLFTGASLKARDCGAMHALMDFVICQQVGKAATFDFEGSNDENLRFFYQSFGGTEKVYLQSQFSRLPSPLNKLIK